jgi:magnesium transporter
MKKKKANYARKAGLPPESLVYTGNRKPSAGEIELLVYDQNNCESKIIRDYKNLGKHINKDKINLLTINNLTDVTLIESIGLFFSIHPMMLEDVLNTSIMPKVEESGDALLLVLKRLDYSAAEGLIQQHISLILGPYFVIIFKDFENTLFGELKSRIVTGKSKARQKQADYLLYLLTDTLIDTYYNIVNEIDNSIDDLEIKLLEKSDDNYIQDIYAVRKSFSDLRGVFYPIREALLNILQGDFNRIEEDSMRYFMDVKDHINQIINMYESGRDTLSDLIELNSSNINNQLNRSMKILTIITTFFIPLSLIAGIYGMNFKFIPELGWKMGYPLVLFVMLLVSGLMFYLMKRNKLL